MSYEIIIVNFPTSHQGEESWSGDFGKFFSMSQNRTNQREIIVKMIYVRGESGMGVDAESRELVK